MNRSARSRMAHASSRDIEEQKNAQVIPFDPDDPLCVVCRGGPFETGPFHVGATLCIFPPSDEFDSVRSDFVVNTRAVLILRERLAFTKSAGDMEHRGRGT